ncbi:MAG: cell division ATPase MinD [Candidatus Aenigmarchaeota archaeon]|nr:cell division ATPase MinD [Candidatus Aenigmarchaeota archaeon]
MEKNSRVIGIISGKGGVGKTVVTINLACALMSFGKDVVALDADVKMSGLGLHLGMYYFSTTLNDILNSEAEILSAIHIHPSGLRIIPASLSLENVNISNLSKVLSSNFFENSIVLVDSPPGLDSNSIEVIKACDEVIIVTLPEIPSVVGAIKTIEFCKEVNVKPFGIIVNRYRKEKEQINYKEIESVCELPVLGVIPEDKKIRKSIYKQFPAFFLNPYSKSSLEFKRIAAKLLGFSYSSSLSEKFKMFLWGLRG